MTGTRLQLVGDNKAASLLDAAEKRIRALVKDWTTRTLELAAELAKAAEVFPPNPKRPDTRPGFMKWAKAATELSPSQINQLLQVHQKFGHRHLGHRLSTSVMMLLARENVPESARQEAIAQSEKGHTVGFQGATKIIAKHKLPTPKAANQQAKEEGHPVLASDGYIYFGTDPGKAKEGTDRRTMVFGVREALAHLGSINLTGRQFLDYAFPHQLWKPDEAPIIKKALRWLTDLDEAWDARE